MRELIVREFVRFEPLFRLIVHLDDEIVFSFTLEYI